MPSFLRSLRSRAGFAADVPLRLRLRLTLFYGVLSVVSGVVLLVIGERSTGHGRSTDAR
jgi:hypothetical protein